MADDQAVLSSYRVSTLSTVHASLKLRGGAEKGANIPLQGQPGGGGEAGGTAATAVVSLLEVKVSLRDGDEDEDTFKDIDPTDKLWRNMKNDVQKKAKRLVVPPITNNSLVEYKIFLKDIDEPIVE